MSSRGGKNVYNVIDSETSKADRYQAALRTVTINYKETKVVVIPIGGPGTFPDHNPEAWPRAVAEMCVPILERLPDYLRVDAASALYTESRAHSNPNTPWTVIFSDDAPQSAAAQLLRTCLTPDKLTPVHSPILRPVINTIRSTFKDKDIERGPATTVLAGWLIQLAAGKPDTSFRVYADEARHTPMKYGWCDLLVEQFGEAAQDVLAAEPRLLSIVKETETLSASLYNDAELAHQVHPNSTTDLTHGFLPLDDRYSLYAHAAYQARELTI